MRLEKLFSIQDDGVCAADNQRVGQTLFNRGTDSCGLIVFEHGNSLREWKHR